MPIPRLLPIIAVAIGGVLAVNALAGARSLPDLFSATKAFAEDSVAKVSAKAGKPDPAKADAAKATDAKAANAPVMAASPLPPRTTPAQAAAAQAAAGLQAHRRLDRPPRRACRPSRCACLENLQARRGQLDDREKSMEMQLTLLAAAEAKLDSRVAALNALKVDITAMLGQADAKQKAEAERMVGVYTTMAQSKPKEAAKQLTIMDDSVRLPIAAGLSNRNLATILANMQPTDAKKLNEALAHRFEARRPRRQARWPPGTAAAAAGRHRSWATAPAPQGWRPRLAAKAAAPADEAPRRQAADAKPADAKPTAAARWTRRQARRRQDRSDQDRRRCAAQAQAQARSQARCQEARSG